MRKACFSVIIGKVLYRSLKMETCVKTLEGREQSKPLLPSIIVWPGEALHAGTIASGRYLGKSPPVNNFSSLFFLRFSADSF